MKKPGRAPRLVVDNPPPASVADVPLPADLLMPLPRSKREATMPNKANSTSGARRFPKDAALLRHEVGRRAR